MTSKYDLKSDIMNLIVAAFPLMTGKILKYEEFTDHEEPALILDVWTEDENGFCEEVRVRIDVTITEKEQCSEDK